MRTANGPARLGGRGGPSGLRTETLGLSGGFQGPSRMVRPLAADGPWRTPLDYNGGPSGSLGADGPLASYRFASEMSSLPYLSPLKAIDAIPTRPRPACPTVASMASACCPTRPTRADVVLACTTCNSLYIPSPFLETSATAETEATRNQLNTYGIVTQSVAMEGAPKVGGGGEKAVVPGGPAGSDANNNAGAARVARRRVPPPSAGEDAPAAAGGGAEVKEDDDEQVERFYALLDNIRAMRGGETGGGGGGGGERKRLRAGEPPWRPAFRMEDFEEPSPTSPSAKRTHRQEDAATEEDGGARPAVASASPPPPPRRAGLRFDSGRKSI
nr:unnamed protein product [Digitaria exilis]